LFLWSQVIAIIVVLALSAYLGWRLWDEHKERQSMEAALKLMTTPNPGPVRDRLGKPGASFPFGLGPDFETPRDSPAESRDVELLVDIYRGHYHWYLLVNHVRVVQLGSSNGYGVVGIEAYRVSRPTADYRAQTRRGNSRPPRLQCDPVQWAFAADFVETLTGSNPVIAIEHFELIHSKWLPSYDPAGTDQAEAIDQASEVQSQSEEIRGTR
jgi:hypothetical protein